MVLAAGCRCCPRLRSLRFAPTLIPAPNHSVPVATPAPPTLHVLVDAQLPKPHVATVCCRAGATYAIEPALLLGSRLMGADTSRSFPTIDIIALVKRRQEYYQVNAALPFSAFSLLSLLQFAVQPLDHYTGVFDITGINHRSQLCARQPLRCASA